MSSSPTLSSNSNPAPSSGNGGNGGPLASMHDVRCGVEFVIGTGKLKVRDCLRLARQSIVRLDQSGGADLELRVHGVTVAHGEVVIMDDVTALRLTRIVAPPGTEAA